MNKKRLLFLIKQKEGIKLDFKLQLDISAESGKKELAKDVCAIANSRGRRGYLIIGIEDRTKNIIGINPRKALDEEKIQQVISSRCEPPIPITVEVIRIDNKDIGIITIYDGGQKPYQIKETGAFYIRRGSITDIMRKSELVAAFEENLLLTAETWPIISSSIELLNMKLVERYFKNKGIDINADNRMFLMESAGITYLDKISKKTKCTFGGMLVFSDKNSICIPHNIIKIVNNIDNNNEKVIMISGNLLDMIDRVEAELYKLLPVDYPTYAVMEAVKNSVMYREYSMVDKMIQIVISKRTIAVISPGQVIMNNNILQNMGYDKRNMWIYEKLIYLDEGKRFINDGKGIERMRNAFRGRGKVKLVNSTAEECFKVILPLNIQSPILNNI